MSSLWEQLAEALPSVLPDTPENAVNGTELLRLVRPKSAEKISAMSDEEFDEVAKLVKLSTIATGRQRMSLDWEHIKDMRDRTNDFIVLFEWIAHCLKEGRPFSYADFCHITEIQKRYA